VTSAPGRPQADAPSIAPDGGPSLANLLDLVLESLGGRDVRARCRALCISPAALVAAQSTFIAAGVEGLREAERAIQRIQLDVELDPLGHTWRRLVLGSFPDELRAWLVRRPEARFFFMHKPPGLRLRFLFPDEALMRQLDALPAILDARTARVPYDPEHYLFGGPAAIDLTHRFFSLDSMAVLAYHRLWLEGRAGLGRADFSLVLLDQALRLLTGDAWELWDAWCKLEWTGRLPEPGSPVWRALAPPVSAQSAARALLEAGGSRRAGASDAEEAVIASFTEGIPALAEAAAQAQRSGALRCGLREVLPFWIVFHWNRMAFPEDQQKRLALLMSHALSPRRPRHA
jgi:thiopeptide-type bacteriocin biosynthesis protein